MCAGNIMDVQILLIVIGSKGVSEPCPRDGDIPNETCHEGQSSAILGDLLPTQLVWARRGWRLDLQRPIKKVTGPVGLIGVCWGFVAENKNF
jgi:hypothetical protein